MKSRDLLSALSPEQRARLAAIQRDPRAVALCAGRVPVVAAKRSAVETSVRAEGAQVAVVLKGLRLVSEANARGHWSKRAGRAQAARMLVDGALAGVVRPAGTRWAVTIVRGGPRALDTDNLAGSAKAIRDAVAAWLGVDDDPSAPVAWEYGQRRGGYLVEVLVRGEP